MGTWMGTPVTAELNGLEESLARTLSNSTDEYGLFCSVMGESPSLDVVVLEEYSLNSCPMVYR